MFIRFAYRDSYCEPNWNEQTCDVRNVEECIRIYGLGVDCEYKILSVDGNPVCPVCGNPIVGYGNNSYPVYMDGAKVCDECNVKYVVPARLKSIREE